MSDNFLINDDFNGELIQLNNSSQIERWCSLLNCKEEDLIDAVSNVGNSAKMVNVFLELNRKKKNAK